MRDLTIVLAGMAAAMCLYSQPVCAEPALVPQPLSAKSLFPLEAEQCGCSAFRQGTLLEDGNVIFSYTTAGGRIRLDGQEREVQHQHRKRSGRWFANIYGSSALVVSTNTVEVPFAPSCAAYPEPPLHGSCHRGRLTVRSKGASKSVPVSVVCGC